MGMTINSEIKTKLTCEDIALIAVALGMYQDTINNVDGKGKEKQLQHAKNLCNRLGSELYSHPKDDFTK